MPHNNTVIFQPLSLLHTLNFHPLEVVSRYREPQIQVGENHSFINLIQKNCKSLCLNTHFVPINCDLTCL